MWEHKWISKEEAKKLYPDKDSNVEKEIKFHCINIDSFSVPQFLKANEDIFVGARERHDEYLKKKVSGDKNIKCDCVVCRNLATATDL